MLKGNKGEWSEVYALLKLLGDRKLFVGDSKLNKLASVFYPIIKIIRRESSGEYGYEIQNRELVLLVGEKELKRIRVNEFAEQAKILLARIKENSGSFIVPELDDFLQSINCTSLKASSSVKSDIRIIIHDADTNQNPELGFSIKSQLGGCSTLLNAGKTTNIIYKILNFKPTRQEINSINNISSASKIKDRLKIIIANHGELRFCKMENEVFYNNLVLIDSKLPEIIAELTKLYYTIKKNTIFDISNVLTEQNPLKYDRSHSHAFYEYKLKRFLTDTALGMMPSKVWNGDYDATGGYLIVKENGDVICYHIYKKKSFEDYLFNNTKLETASTTKFDFGRIYSDNTSCYIKLNIQIRFI